MKTDLEILNEAKENEAAFLALKFKGEQMEKELVKHKSFIDKLVQDYETKLDQLQTELAESKAQIFDILTELDASEQLVEKLESSQRDQDIDHSIKCPFCNDEDFDRMDLKYHLENYCQVFKETSSPM